MIMSLGAAGTMIGTAFLAFACTSAGNKRGLEQWGGGLFLGGLTLLALSFAMV